MPRPIQETMPQTLAEWNELCENTLFNQREAYEEACAAARAEAETQWEKELPARRSALLARVPGSALADSEGKPLAEAEQQAILAEAARQIDAELDRQKQEAVNNAVIGIERPHTLEQIQTTYKCYRPGETAALPEMPHATAGPDSIYKVGERFYSVAAGAWLETEPDPARVIELGGEQTEQNLRETLEFFHLPVGDCLLTPEELVKRRRSAIDADTSAAILGDFDYEVNGETLHFSYDAFDQQNFADTANACLMRKAGNDALPDTVTWNAYRHGSGELVRLTLSADEFLVLYAGGALNHKAACMEAGGAKKAGLAAAEVL